MPRSAARTLTSPRMLLLHAIGVAALTVAVLLALWQYDAWQTGRDLAARNLAVARPVPLDDVLGPDDAYPGDQVGRPVELSGEWRPAGTLEVTDRALDGRSGRWMVTPLAVCNPGRCARAPAVLVVRGWVADGTDAPAPPTGRADLTGWLQPGEGQGVPDPDPGDDRLPELRIASAVQHVDTDLYGGYVIARSATPEGRVEPGLAAVTPAALPKPDAFTALRNLFYSVEWLVFGGFAAFIWWRWTRDELERVSAAESVEPAEDLATPEIASSP